MEANEISLDLEYEKRDENGKLEYEGISFVENEFPAFLKQTISPIYKDEDYNAQMKEVAIDMTGFDSENLQAVFDTMPKVSNFRIGELVAEKIVESRYSAKFTYNSDRDLKNPNSNNTGADLVGFIEMEDGAVNFLFGEVKTSEEHTNPPGVMYGRSVIIGFQKTQIYQRFAGSRKEVFILKNSKMTRTTPPNRTTGGVFIYKTMKGGHFHPASLRTGFFHATKRRFANGR